MSNGDNEAVVPNTVVAIFNTSEDTIDMLRTLFEHHGFVVVSAFTYELRDGETDLETVMRQHRPAVVVYDIALPYEANWRLFQHIRATPACAGIPFVVTSTNEAQVRKIAGSEETILEIVGKPYDLGRLLDAVVAAIAKQ
jgi:DNA-binding response OmpR family regulator